MAKTNVEDCLNRIDNRFILVIIAVVRTKQLIKGNATSLKNIENNEQIIALKEIAAGFISIRSDTKIHIYNK